MLEAPETETGPDAGYSSQTLAVKEYQGQTGWSWAGLRDTASHLSYRTALFLLPDWQLPEGKSV